MITRIQEKVASGGKIDRKAGVIHDVKLLGADSQNNRTYSPEAMKQAVKLYEGATVRIDHNPDKHNRPMLDDIGILSGVYESDSAIFANEFQVLKAHPMAELVFEKAERFPGTFGFSHHADGLVESDGTGREIVRELRSVESVDLVTKPATNSSLFEGEDGNPEAIEGEDLDEADTTPLSASIAAILNNGDLDIDQKLAEVAKMVGEDASVVENTIDDEPEPVQEEDSIPSYLKDFIDQVTDAVKQITDRVENTETKLTEQIQESERNYRLKRLFESRGVRFPSDEEMSIAEKLDGEALDTFLEGVRQVHEIKNGGYSPIRSSAESNGYEREYSYDQISREGLGRSLRRSTRRF